MSQYRRLGLVASVGAAIAALCFAASALAATPGQRAHSNYRGPARAGISATSSSQDSNYRGPVRRVSRLDGSTHAASNRQGKDASR
jgi:hypothetical protein